VSDVNQALIDQVVADLKSLGTLTPSGEKITSMKGALDTVNAAIVSVEKLTKDATSAVSGSTKKAVVIAVVNEFVSIPFVPQWLFDDVLSYGIDLVITFLNKYLGGTWLGNLVGLTAPTAG
jgi:hypothetical protein